jgi:hypothetical protein
MERILQTFKEYDKEVLLAKKTLVVEELKKNKDLQESLVKLLERIEKAIEENNNKAKQAADSIPFGQTSQQANQDVNNELDNIDQTNEMKKEIKK